MSIKWKPLVFSIVLLLIPLCASSQLFKRLNKGTSKRDIRKRQEEADKKSDYNKFNKLQAMGKKSTQKRNDFLWSAETANVVPYKGGDIAIVGTTRYSFTKGIEAGGSLGAMYFAPNLYLKKRWQTGKYYVASKHQLYTYTPLLYFAGNREWNLLNDYSDIPNVLAMKNELIISRPFLKQLSCGGAKQPFLVITLGVGVDYGYKFNRTNVDSLLIDNAFLESRGGVVLGDNGFGTIRLQADYLINTKLYATLAFRGIISDHNFSNAIEHNANIQYHFSPKFSISGGFLAHYSSREGFDIIPLMDLKYHFGLREGRDEGLFDKKGYKTLKKKDKGKLHKHKYSY